jgi:hypothetical protein
MHSPTIKRVVSVNDFMARKNAAEYKKVGVIFAYNL